MSTILGLFGTPDGTVRAVDTLYESGVAPENVHILTGAPYPEGAFGEREEGHKVYIFPLVGAACGFVVAVLITIGTQLSYPLVTGGKPILGIPPMIIIMYEGTMLGAILFTVIGVIFESRLPRFELGAYDPRITEGMFGVLVVTPEDRLEQVRQLFQNVNADDIVVDRQGT